MGSIIIMDTIRNLLDISQVTVIFRLLLALIAGVMIGADRSRRGSPAGIKTHSLVCIGSALIMLLSEFLVDQYGGGDIARLPAQVITGIGFLGAGTILVIGKNQVKGLTSAANIWFSGCVGLAIGAHFYVGAITAVFLEIITLKVISRLDFGVKYQQVIEVYIEYDQNLKVSDLIQHLKNMKCQVMSIDKSNFSVFDSDTKKNVIMTLTVSNNQVETILNDLISIEGITDVNDI